MNHLMIDLETMGNTPNAPIVAIGAVFFEPSTGETGAEFSATVSLASEIALGAIPDQDTIDWWLRQSSEARAAICTDQISIHEALKALTQFVKVNKEGGCQVWGNGAAFDNVILRAAYQRIGQPAFWLFIRDRDVRTMVELGRQIGFDPKRDIPFEGERHNALADAIHQAKYISAIWQKIIPTTSAELLNAEIDNRTAMATSDKETIRQLHQQVNALTSIYSGYRKAIIEARSKLNVGNDDEADDVLAYQLRVGERGGDHA